jgi:hypothetical protein
MGGAKALMDGAEALAGLVAEELAQPVPEAARCLAEAIRGRTGPATAAILFYGSCLRKRSAEGVLDFYVLVDAYRAANAGRRLALAGALLPPNVFYLELAGAGGVLRAKYAVVTLEDFAHGAAGRWLRTGIWARFSQPARAVYLRDAAAEQAVVAACAESVLTLVERALPMLPGEGDRIRAAAADLWQTAFSETYAAEMRPEQPEAIAGLFQDQPGRYARAAQLAALELEARGRLRVLARGDPLEIELRPGERRRGRRAARIRRPFAKLAYVAQLLKTGFTFGDWLPYALWKLERHTETRFVMSQRQRRHPFLFGLPLLVRALRERALR